MQQREKLLKWMQSWFSQYNLDWLCPKPAYSNNLHSGNTGPTTDSRYNPFNYPRPGRIKYYRTWKKASLIFF
jgi:hypothetical protein